jgi:hypothetical protein
MISIPSGNGSQGIVGIPLQPFLMFHEKRVSRECQIFQGFTKKFHEPILHRNRAGLTTAIYRLQEKKRH